MVEPKKSGIIENWLEKLEKYKISHKDGFYIIPTLFNSPEIMVEGVHRIPFTKFNKETNSHHFDLFFMKTNAYYHKLEEGFWVVVSDFKFKANTAIKNIYDEKSPTDYHFINIFINDMTEEETFKQKRPMIADKEVLVNNTWTIFKPAKAKIAYYFKDTLNKNVTILFNNQWLSQQQALTDNEKFPTITHFFHSDTEDIVLCDPEYSDPDSPNFYDRLIRLIHSDSPKKNEVIHATVLGNDLLFHGFART